MRYFRFRTVFVRQVCLCVSILLHTKDLDHAVVRYIAQKLTRRVMFMLVVLHGKNSRWEMYCPKDYMAHGIHFMRKFLD